MVGEPAAASEDVVDKAKLRYDARKRNHKEREAAKRLAESKSDAGNNTTVSSFGDNLAMPARLQAGSAEKSSPLHKLQLSHLNGKASDAQEGDSRSKAAASGRHFGASVGELPSPRSDKSDQTITPTNFNLTPRKQSRSAANTINMAQILKDGPAGNQEEVLSAITTVALPFKFDSLHPQLKCPKPDCRKLTSCWDSVVVICPACGPNSFTRYCCKDHLYKDIRRHWLLDCGKRPITGPVDPDTVCPSQLPRTSYITGHFSNHIERHRQAVYRAMEPADYFIFDDMQHLTSDMPTKVEWNLVRGIGKVQKSISFLNDGTMLCPHAFFNHHIMQCLKFGGPLAKNSSNMALHMIIDFLIVEGSWSEEMLTTLCMQIAMEWGYKVPEHFYNVEEVNAVYRNFGGLPMPLPFKQG